jgi:penicillin amidase
VSGTLIVDGLVAPVTVVRDRSGIPHITAANQDDLFFAQGFVQAQDRLFQMDLWRRSSQGRLSEVLGANFIERDAATRRVQYRGGLEEEWGSYGPETKAIATSFTRGINARLEQAFEQLPEEFALAGWKPERWQPEDLLNRTAAFVASADAAGEVFRAQTVSALGAARTDLLFPPQGGGRTLVDRGVDLSVVNSVLSDILRRIGAPPVFSGFAAPLASATRADTNSDGRAAPAGQSALAEGNAWAISRSNRPDRAALVAGAPQQPFIAPSMRYLVHLTAPGWNVIGATSPWLPGVAFGHNDDIAWSPTASPADVQDLYVETLNPQNPRQVRYRDAWVDMRVERDAVAVKGRAEPFEYERLYTRNGVVVGLDRERNLAYTLRWSGTEPGAAGELASLAIDRAASWSEFRTALRRWKMPTAEFVYGDRAGHIGRQLAGLVPRRRAGAGHVPAGGRSGLGDWQGWLSAVSLPSTGDPGVGVLVSGRETASLESRLIEALKQPSSVDVDAAKRLQRQAGTGTAAQLVSLLRRLHAEEPAVEAARNRLVDADRSSAGGAAAALYAGWEAALRRLLIDRRIPSALRADAVSRLTDIAAPLVRPTSAWFDGDPAAARDALLIDALAAAMQEPASQDEQAWKRARSVTFVHPLGLSERARRRFNIGPFVMPGNMDNDFDVGGSGGWATSLILDAADWDRSVGMNAPGQSGAATSPHFADMARLWAEGNYVFLPFSKAAVQTAAETMLVLTPKQPKQ